MATEQSRFEALSPALARGRGLGEGGSSALHDATQAQKPPSPQPSPPNDEAVWGRGSNKGDALAKLLAWTSPSYPTGAFCYSHGLEWAVEEGSVRDVATLVDYTGAVLTRGGGWVDAVLFARAYECAHNAAALDAIAELAVAFRGSAETALESCQQGAAFLGVTRKAWPHALLDAFAARHADLPVAHSIAMALACAAHDVPCEPALSAWLHGTCANLVSAGVRLVPLGQTDGQIATARLASIIAGVVADALAASLDDLGTAAPLLELCSIRHETQYTRLFRS
ncbi:MAG: urease accessory protein UreF [Gammaproteobacteria bacterium]|nr:MAG: urease accessory protein UreF [Gammaproteobacteria bacterium]